MLSDMAVGGSFCEEFAVNRRTLSAWLSSVALLPMPPNGAANRKKKIQKRKRAKARARQPSRHAPEVSADAAGATAGSAASSALEYLEAWRDREGGEWKFNKNRQSYLLRAWPEPTKMPRAAFELLLLYASTLHPGARARAAEQARTVASEAEAELKVLEGRPEGEADEGDGERAAVLKIRLMRSLKVEEALEGAEDGEEGGEEVVGEGGEKGEESEEEDGDGGTGESGGEDSS